MATFFSPTLWEPVVFVWIIYFILLLDFFLRILCCRKVLPVSCGQWFTIVMCSYYSRPATKFLKWTVPESLLRPAFEQRSAVAIYLIKQQLITFSTW